jgi:hypothetical protein
MSRGSVLNGTHFYRFIRSQEHCFNKRFMKFIVHPDEIAISQDEGLQSNAGAPSAERFSPRSQAQAWERGCRRLRLRSALESHSALNTAFLERDRVFPAGALNPTARILEVAPAKAGVKEILKSLDSAFCRNDGLAPPAYGPCLGFHSGDAAAPKGARLS